MSKIKIFALAGGTVCLILAAIIGASLWHAHNNNQVSDDTTNSLTTATSSSANNLTPAQTPTSTNNLSVGNQTSNNASTQSAQDQSNSSGSQFDPASLLDPTTFVKYDKYKNDTSAYFIDLKAGTGDELTSGKKANVYYKGWLTNGQLFDMSKADKKGQLQAFSFTLGQHQVITGWEQGLAGMKVGGVRLLIIPPAVGYGQTGQAPIPPNSVLIFQVQLVAVQ